MTIDENKYNLHCFLSDITHSHFKSKLLCKLGYHNYQIHGRKLYMPSVEAEKDKTGRILFKTTKYEIGIENYWKCYCCGKEEKFERKENI